MTYVDGWYAQKESFSIRMPSGLTVSFSYEELVQLGAVVVALLEAREEAHSWPFGEYEERRERHLPIRREEA